MPASSSNGPSRAYRNQVELVGKPQANNTRARHVAVVEHMTSESREADAINIVKRTQKLTGFDLSARKQ